MKNMNNNKNNPIEVLQLYLASEMHSVNRLINTYMKSETAPIISKLADHLINAGGKRLRPLLTLAAAVLIFGFYPQPIIDTMKLSVDNLIFNYQLDLIYHLKNK